MSDLNPPLPTSPDVPVINQIVTPAPAVVQETTVIEVDAAPDAFEETYTLGGQEFTFEFPIPGLIIMEFGAARTQADVLSVYTEALFASIKESESARLRARLLARPVVGVAELRDCVQWIFDKAAGRPLES